MKRYWWAGLAILLCIKAVAGVASSEISTYAATLPIQPETQKTVTAPPERTLQQQLADQKLAEERLQEAVRKYVQAQEAERSVPAGTRYYINVDGERVQSPTYYPSTPAGASAKCKDGTYSFSQNRRGTCSGHGGVARWL